MSEEGVLLYEGEVSNNKPFGQGKAFWPDGKLYMEGESGIKGLLKGTIYRKDGTRKFECWFRGNRGCGPIILASGTFYEKK